MSISINSNLAALRALRALDRSSDELSRTFTRLSSGQRINRPSDDAAGLSIASSLDAATRVYTQATRNGNDALSLLNVAQGAVGGLSDIVVRLKELASQAANGSLARSQRVSLDREAYALTQEYNRLVASTRFNSLSILSPDQSDLLVQLGFGNLQSIGFNSADRLKRDVGTGAFGSATALGLNSSNREIAGDFNGDGKLDLITFSSATLASVQLGNGDGTFTADGSIALSSNISSLAVGDFDGNGTAEIAVGLLDGTVQLYSRASAATYQVVSTTTLSAPAYTLQAGDLNRDGNLDLIAVASTAVQSLLGNGQGAFQVSNSSVTIDGTSQSAASQLGDYDGDGILDLVTVSNITGVNYVLHGVGNGTFTNATSFSTSKNVAFTFTDFNHDGYDDLVFTNGTLKLSNGDGSFLTQSTGSTSNGRIRSGDFNGDGYVDFLILDTAGQVITRFGNGDGTFQTAITSTAAASTALSVGDFNGDGVSDLIVGVSGNTNLYLGNTTIATTIQHLNLLTAASARDALSTLEQAHQRIGQHLGSLGAAMSRLGSALGTLQSTTLNYAAASSRIKDVDVAEETANLIKTQILENSVAAVLAQANAQPALALRLLNLDSSPAP